MENLPVGRQTKVKTKSSTSRPKKKAKHFFLLRSWTRHQKNSEPEPKFRRHEGPVVLRGNVVKDDAGSKTVLKKQGSSASQMTAEKVLDIICRIFLHSQVK